MEKVEQYIKEYTRNCSNEWYDDLSQGYEPWLTPDHTRCVAQIAREETIKEMCEWIDINIADYLNINKSGTLTANTRQLFEDLKKHLEE